MIAYRVYIDESGDECFKFLQKEEGSSRWFVLSAAETQEAEEMTLLQKRCVVL
ncbi:MAG: DUF3800 domain-containing protein [Proteobacteria bacterium]|nr:DUF3800 domain-containing protein [Pseudomonadota bacterium]MCL2306794.1 DUF3800 domain-containing protein [Pseudomonadota bacterium]